MKKFILIKTLVFCFLVSSAFGTGDWRFVAPTFNSSSIINNTTGTQFTLRVNVNQAGTIYYIVTTTDTNPTSAEVKAGQAGGGGSPAFSGNFAHASAANADNVISSLTPGASYFIHFISENGSSEQSSVQELTATATDSTVPTLTASIQNNTTSSTFTVRGNSNENGTIFYVVTTSNTAPSASQVIAGQDNLGATAFKSGSSAAIAGVDVNQVVTLLAPATTYYVYSVAVDGSTNPSTVDSKNATTLCMPVNVTGLKTSDASTTVRLFWTDATCFDEVLIVAKQGTASIPAVIAGTPSGNGSAYTANASFTSGPSTAFDGGKVIFKSSAAGSGGGAGQNFTDFTTGVIYSFRVFTRKGTEWSSGNSITTVPGPPVIISLSPADGATGVSPTGPFTITFNENIFISNTNASGAEDDLEFEVSGGTDVVIQRGAGAPELQISGRVLTIIPNTDLDADADYDVLIGNNFLGDSTASINAAGVDPDPNDFIGMVAGNWDIHTAAGTASNNPSVGTCVGQFAAVPTIILAEGSDNNFQGTPTGNFTITLGLDKAGYIFDPSANITASPTSGGDINTITVASKTYTQIQLSVTFKSGASNSNVRNDHDDITINGIKVSRDGTNAPPAHIVISASTLTIQGVTIGTTPMATINGGTSSTPPTVSWPAGDNSHCSNANLTGVVLTVSGGSSYTWYNDAALTSAIAGVPQSGPTAAQVFTASPGIGTFTKYVTSKASGCESTGTAVTLTVTSLPIANAGSDQNVCPSEQLTLGGSPTATGGSGSYTYAWTSSPAGFVSNVANPTFNASATTDHIYSVTVSDVNNCTHQDNVSVTIKIASEPATISAPTSFSFTPNNNPINLEGKPDGGIFSGVGVTQLDTAFEFDPGLTGNGTWPVTYTVTLANGCVASVSQDFEVDDTYDVFSNLDPEYCNNEGSVSLRLSAATVTKIKAHIASWNARPGYGKLKTTFGIIRNTYEIYYGTNNSVQKVAGTYTEGGLTFDNYRFNPWALATDQPYGTVGGKYGTCTNCSYGYVTVFLEFVDPRDTYPYTEIQSSPLPFPLRASVDYGYAYWDAVNSIAAIEYTGEFVTVNPVPNVSFTGLSTSYCNANQDVLITGNKSAGFFEISNNGSTWADVVGDGIIDVTEEPTLNAGTAKFNPQPAFGGPGTQNKYVRYSVDPGTVGSDGTTGCIGRSQQFFQIHPSTTISFASSVPDNLDEFCYEGASFELVTDRTPPTTGVIFSGFGVSDAGNGTATFNPKIAFDQKNPSATTNQTITVTAQYTNSNGCAYVINRDFVVRPKPISVYTVQIQDDNGGNPADMKFCYNEPRLYLQGNKPANTTRRFEIEFIGLSYTNVVNKDTMYFNLDTYFDLAISKGASKVSDVAFNINYIITENGIGCNATYTTQVVISPLAEIDVQSDIQDGAIFCSNEPAAKIAFAPAGGLIEVNGNTPNPLPQGTTISSGDLPSGNVEISYRYESGASKCVTTAVMNVIKVRTPVAAFVTNPSCDLVPITYTAANDPDGQVWNWTINGETRTTQSFDYTFPSLGGATNTTHVVSLEVKNLGAPKECSSILSQNQVIGAYPNGEFTYADVCEGDATILSVTSTVPIAEAQWNFGDGISTPRNALNDDITGVPATTGKFVAPRHTYGASSRNNVAVRIYTANNVGACLQTLTHEVAILKKIIATPTSPYLMASANPSEGDGYWIDEDVIGQSSWEFNVPSKTVITNSDKVWITAANSAYLPGDYSYVNSPCFNLSTFTKPVISLDYFSHTENKDGAVLQFSKDGGATWDILGNMNTGLEWYNASVISSFPLAQLNRSGWTTENQLDWKTAKHSLNSLGAPPSLTNVRFRMVFSSDLRDESDGFGFYNVKIEERDRVTLVEHFTNQSADASPSRNNFNNATSINSPEVVKLQYHTSFPDQDPLHDVAQPDIDSRVAFYGVTPQTIPLGVIDGRIGNILSFVNIPSAANPWFEDNLDKRSLNASPFTLALSNPASPDDDKLMVNVDITLSGTEYIGNKPVLHVAVVEQLVDGNEFVVRKLIPNAAGTPVFDPTTFALRSNIELEWTPNFALPENNTAIIAFIQDEVTKEVHQSGMIIDAADLNIPTIITDAEEDLASTVRVYPNPADKELTIVLNGKAANPINVKFIDSFGREVQQSIIQRGKQETTLSTIDFAGGVYILQLKTSKGVVRKKVMVTHQ